jgi:hypothetical protein
MNWSLAAVLALFGAEEAREFPCEALGDELLEVHEGFAPAAAAVQGAVAVKKKAVLFDATAALRTKGYTLAEPLPAADVPAPIFRPYRRGGQAQVCTGRRSDALFGAGDMKEQYMLRCLQDGDGDGRYEGFIRWGKLVPMRDVPRVISAEDADRAPETPELRPLPRPVALVEREDLADPNDFMKEKARMRITVARVQGQEVQLRFSATMTPPIPDHIPGGSWMSVAETLVTMPMTESGEVPFAGTRIRFAKSGRGWTASVPDGFGRPPRLICSGSVAEVGDSFTILGAGSKMNVARSSLPAPGSPKAP